MKIKKNAPLFKYTTWKIGGSADYLVETSSSKELIEAIDYGKKKKLPVTVLGQGSNVLISDRGIRGLVIVNSSQNWQILGGVASEIAKSGEKITPRQVQLEEKIRFEDLYYQEDDRQKIKIKAESGVGLTWLVKELLKTGITGIHWFAGIPGTVGGAVYNNIHAGHLFIGDYVVRVEVLNEEGKINNFSAKECRFDYDSSRFHKNKEIILSVEFELLLGNRQKAKKFIETWLGQRKVKYPLPSAGCVFKNIDRKTQERLNLPTPSWGYIIDKILKLKGKQIGGAQISDTHSAFIVNKKNAKAKDVLALVDLVKKESKKKLKIEPELEIFLLGSFDD
jgi:UDP-N-acetylmuramate dehydrogenase